MPVTNIYSTPRVEERRLISSIHLRYRHLPKGLDTQVRTDSLRHWCACQISADYENSGGRVATQFIISIKFIMNFIPIWVNILFYPQSLFIPQIQKVSIDV